jgi:hypothetical protein
MNNLRTYYHRFNKYFKTEKFKNKLFKYTLTVVLSFMVIQVAVLRTPLPSMMKKGRDWEEGGET